MDRLPSQRDPHGHSTQSECVPAHRGVFDETSALRDLLRGKGIEDLWNWTDLRVFARTDDGWLEQLLQTTLGALEDLANRSARQEELRRLLRVFLHRETRLLPSLWKRLDQFVPFALGVHQTVVKRFRRDKPPPWPWPSSDDEYGAMQDLAFESPGAVASTRFVNGLQRVLKRLATTRAPIVVMRDLEDQTYDGRFFLSQSRSRRTRASILEQQSSAICRASCVHLTACGQKA